MEDRRAEIDNSNLETMEFVPDFTSSIIQANKPIQEVKFFQGVDLGLITQNINEFIEGKSLVNIQYQANPTDMVGRDVIWHSVMVHYLKED